MHDFVVSLDPGKRTDYAGLAVLELPCYVRPTMQRALDAPDSGWVSPLDLTASQRVQCRGLAPVPQNRMPIRLIQAKRYPLRTKHHAIVDDIATNLIRGALAGMDVALVVDRTGVGEGVVEAFDLAGLKPIGIFISGGQDWHYDTLDHTYSVPKRELSDAIRIPLEERRFQFAPDIHDLPALKRELENFAGTINDRGHGTYAAQVGKDDLVLAISMGCWYAAHPVGQPNIRLVEWDDDDLESRQWRPWGGQ